MASRSSDSELGASVAGWLQSRKDVLAEHGYTTVHIDELGEAGDGHDPIQRGLVAFRALIRHGESIAADHRLLLSFPLVERDDAVPLLPDCEPVIWRELDDFQPPSLSVVDRGRNRKLFDEESYLCPLAFDGVPIPPTGRVAVHYVATRSRLYRDNGWNYVAAIVFEYFPDGVTVEAPTCSS
jgi:hypothetical protein